MDDLSASAAAVAADEDAARIDIEAEILARSVRWEIGFTKFQLAVTGVGIVMALVSWNSLGPDLSTMLAVFGLSVGVYFVLVWRLLERGLWKAHSWATWVNATVLASVPTAILLIDAQIKGAEWPLSAPSVLLYCTMLAVNAVRMRPMVCLYVGVIEILEYLALYYLVLEPRIAADLVERLPTLDTWGVWHRCVWILSCAVAIAFATWRLRELAFELGTEGRRRKRVEEEFGRYASRDVADAILRGRTQFGAAERREVSVLFCDLRDFTHLCEQRPPEEVVELLNRFYGRACEIVEQRGGMINKFMGDGMLALFGAPHDLPEHAAAASESARAIIEAARELRTRGGLEDLEVGIGLDTGPVVVGGIGAEHRAEYTAIGTTVNRAARLQGLTRKGPFRVVLSADFVARLPETQGIVSIGPVRLKGLSEPVEAYAYDLERDS
jgi:adenylate cyclase